LLGHQIRGGFGGGDSTRAPAAAMEELAAVNNSASPAIWTNGIRLNGIRLNGIRLNGIRLNGIRLNGIRLNGIRLNGIRLNGIRLSNGIRLNGVQLMNGVGADNGLTRVSGLDLANGVQSHPYIGTIDLRNDARLDGAPGPYFYASKNSVLAAWIDQDPDETRMFLRYMVECALPEGVSVRLKYKGATSLLGTGYGNLGASLQAGQMSVDDQEKVSSCLLARMSTTGKHMEIDLLGPYRGFETPADPKRFNVREAAYYGNLFASPIEAYMWLPDRAQARPCTGDGDCGVLQPVGAIAGALYGAIRADAQAGECFVTGAEAPGTLNMQEARFGKEKLVPLSFCKNPVSGRTYTNVMTVLTQRLVAEVNHPNGWLLPTRR